MSALPKTHRITRTRTLHLRRCGLLTVVIAASGLSTLAGCSKPLFPDTAYRTQFDHYDRQRGQFVEQKQYDRYGKPVPAIRERLRLR